MPMLSPKEEAALQLISEDLTYENYFFNKVSNLKWFYPLKEKEYFSPEKAPVPKEAEQKGYFIIPQWNVLPYLEKVSQQVTIAGNEKYSDELLGIIKNVTKYYIGKDRKLDNYRTWWYFVKILINIPDDKIIKYLKENNIKIGQDWIKEWVTSRFDNSLPASDIATKLIPKFLTKEQEDIEIAEQIINVITDMKQDFFEEEAIQKIGIFEKRKEPKTTIDSYWLLESFKKNSQKIGELCSERVIYGLADKLKSIFNKEHEDHQVLIELNNNTYRIYAKRKENFDFEVKIEVLNKSELEKLKPEDRYFGILKVSGEILHTFTLSNIRSKKDFIKATKDEIAKNDIVSFLNSFDELGKKIRNLYDGLYSDYSFIWYKSLTLGPDVGIINANEVLTSILRDVLMSKCKSNPPIGRTVLNKFLGKEYQFPLFRRLVLFVINSNWSEYRDLFWQFLECIPHAFDESDYEVELYKLLQQNVNQFTPEEKEKVRNMISRGPRWLPDEKQEVYTAYWKQKWYFAMREDPYFAELYEEQRKISKIEKVEPPSEKGLVEVHWGEGPSPLSKEGILAMSNLEIAKYLNEFQEKDRWEGPTRRGLAEALKATVKENPNKFVEDLSPFLNVDYLYVYNILYGFEGAWKEKKSFNWGKLFNFAKKYINKENFLEESKKAQGEDWHSDHIWIINVIADLIQEGTRDDSWAFPEDYFGQAEEIIDILLRMLEKFPKKEEVTHRDFVTEALNTSYGGVIIAIILFSLRKARVDDKKGVKKDIRWDPLRYNKLLKDGIIEAFTLFGQYMPNFAYLNRTWIEQKIREFENLTCDDIKWQAFMEGYLFGYRVYKDLYHLMRNHYLKAIENEFGKDHEGDRLVQHISIGYLRGDESIDGEDSLFKKVIDKWKYSQIQKIVDYFWSQGRSLKEEVKEKESEEDKKVKNRIREFWRWTYADKDMIKNKLKDDYKKFLSSLTKLTILLDRIDSETSKWLLLSAPYVGEESGASFFIEYLDRFNDERSLGYISKILLKMLDAITPWFRQENIISIVRKIYQSGNKSDADKICNIYVSRGYEFLRPIYEEHNKK